MGLGNFIQKAADTVQNAVRFEANRAENIVESVAHQPERAVLGINTQFDTGLWNSILNRNYKPISDNYGGASKQDYETADPDTVQAGALGHGIARTIASFYAGGAGGIAGTSASVGMGANAAYNATANAQEKTRIAKEEADRINALYGGAKLVSGDDLQAAWNLNDPMPTIAPKPRDITNTAAPTPNDFSPLALMLAAIAMFIIFLLLRR